MINKTFKVPERTNEETKQYVTGSSERNEIIETYNSMYSQKLDNFSIRFGSFGE